MSDLLTVQDVARYCQLHEGTVRRHITSGQLRSVRVGRAVRIRREDLEEFLEPTPVEMKQDENELANAKPFTMDDPLWDIVGMIDATEGDDWVSSDKRRALAEAYATKP